MLSSSDQLHFRTVLVWKVSAFGQWPNGCTWQPCILYGMYVPNMYPYTITGFAILKLVAVIFPISAPDLRNFWAASLILTFCCSMKEHFSQSHILCSSWLCCESSRTSMLSGGGWGERCNVCNAYTGSVIPKMNTGIILHYICCPEYFAAAGK